ncbi:MAG: metallophosphoesterase [Planctomycetales bacterium]|nr:metallophosphoesterase [Planctomycetales bacterium]
MSDLHIEFADFDTPDVDADVTVLAGDVHTRDRGLQFARALSNHRPIVYVAGNHEFYGTAVPTRVVSNQRGYPGECPQRFDPGLVVAL